MRSSCCKIILSIFFIFQVNSILAGLTFESNAPTKEVTKEVTKDISKEIKLTAGKSTPPSFVPEKLSDIPSEEIINQSLKRFDILLASESKVENVIIIQTNRISSFLQLAKIARIKSGGKALVPEEEQYLKKALFLIEKILKQKITDKLAGQMYYFQGLSYLDLGLREKSRVSFEASVTKYPSANFTSSIGLYLADLYYDDGELKKAETAYKRFYSIMSVQEKNLADYKLGWINLNQSKVIEASEIFLNLVQTANSKSIVLDSILSLSVALSEAYDQDAVISKLEKAKISDENRLKIYWGVYENFLKQPNKDRTKIWEIVLKSEIEGAGIVRLFSSEIQAMDLDKNLLREIEYIKKIEAYFTLYSDKIKKFEAAYLTSLSQDFEILISKSLNLFQKSKNENHFLILHSTIGIYLNAGIFARQVELTSLLMDIYLERQAEAELMSLCELVLSDIKYASLQNKAKLLVLLNLEKKYLQDPKKFESKFFNNATAYLSDLKIDQWEDVANKFTDYLLKSKKFIDAEKLVSILNTDYKKDESFIKLITIKYELNKCPELLLLLKAKPDLTKFLTDYKRECYLKIALDAKKLPTANNEYQANILEFIEMSDGPKKSAAIQDFLNTLEKTVDYKNIESIKKFQTTLEGKFFPQRFEKEIFPIYQREILRLFEVTEIDKALEYLKGCDDNPICSKMKVIQSNSEEMKFYNAAPDLKSIQTRKRDLNSTKYLSLISPEVFIQLDHEFDQKLYLPILAVANRLIGINYNEPANKDLHEKLKDFITKDERPFIYAPSLLSLNKVNLPPGNIRHKLKDQDILFYMTKVQQTRKLVLKDLSNLSLVSQKIILNKAIEIEKRMGEVIRLSPIPKKLDPSKIPEYDAGLKELSNEFDQQAEAYKATILSFDQQNAMSGANDYDNLVSPARNTDWNWGSSDQYSEITKKLVEENKFFQCLFYLDYWRSAKKITNEDYFYKRSGVLLFSGNQRKKSNPMIKYIVQELLSSKQDLVLKDWLGRSKK